MRLREHHCVNPEFPVLPGGSHDGLDDGVRNGWFPDITYREVGGIIRVEDRDHHLVSRYETYVEGRPNSHSEDTCAQCGRRKEDEEADLMARVRANADASMHVESEADNRSFSPDRCRRLTSSSRSAQCSPSRLSPFAADSSESDSSESHADTESDAEEERMRMSVNEALGPDTSIDELLESEMEHVPGDPDEQDDFEEFISNECNGVHDIIVTGEVRGFHLCIEADSSDLYLCRPSQDTARHGTISYFTAAFAHGMVSSRSCVCRHTTLCSVCIFSAATSSRTRTLLDHGVHARATHMRSRWRAHSS